MLMLPLQLDAQLCASVALGAPTGISWESWEWGGLGEGTGVFLSFLL